MDVCRRHLLTSYGLRSLAPGAADYHPHYGGDVRQRDGGYHQGAVWGWLLGHFALACVPCDRRRGGGAGAAGADARCARRPGPWHDRRDLRRRCTARSTRRTGAGLVGGLHAAGVVRARSCAPGRKDDFLMPAAKDPERLRLQAMREADATGGGGDPMSASGNGGRCARTTAKGAPRGIISRMTTPAVAPIAGARMAWRGFCDNRQLSVPFAGPVEWM